MLGRLIYTAAMSIAADREALLNEIYDGEHIPTLKAVPGVVDVRRYRRVHPSGRFYFAAYEITDAHVPTSAEWLRARDLGRWPTDVRPYTSGLQNGLYSWREGFGGEARRDASGLTLVMAQANDPAPNTLHAIHSQPATDAFVVAGAHYVDPHNGAHLLVVGLRAPVGPADAAHVSRLDERLALEVYEPASLAPGV
jgi:hypothetical protein